MIVARLYLPVKVPIDHYAVIDLDAPTLPAYEAVIDGATVWHVWCAHCCRWHRHGAGEEHREAHCRPKQVKTPGCTS